MASDKIVNLTSDNFAEVVGGDLPVLVDFWAAWCGPCRMVVPILDEIAEKESDRLVVAKLNVDDNQELANQYQVSNIPTFILFHKGEVKDRMMGAMQKGVFEKFLERNL